MKILGINRKKKFNELYKNGTKIFSPICKLLIIPADEWRIAVSVSRKNGNSVKRNKIKRRFKHIIRSILLTQNRTPSYMWFIINKKHQEFSFDTIDFFLTKMLK